MAQELTVVVTAFTGKQGGAVAWGLIERTTRSARSRETQTQARRSRSPTPGRHRWAVRMVRSTRSLRLLWPRASPSVFLSQVEQSLLQRSISDFNDLLVNVGNNF